MNEKRVTEVLIHMVRERLKPVSQPVFKPSAPPGAGLDKQ
jgi:hypothetical protein